MAQIRSIYREQILIEAAQLRIEAAKLPPGRARDAILQRVSRLELSANIDGWINSPGLRCPEDKPNESSRRELRDRTRPRAT